MRIRVQKEIIIKKDGFDYIKCAGCGFLVNFDGRTTVYKCAGCGEEFYTRTR